jgi:hypothetical protein
MVHNTMMVRGTPLRFFFFAAQSEDRARLAGIPENPLNSANAGWIEQAAFRLEQGGA